MIKIEANNDDVGKLIKAFAGDFIKYKDGEAQILLGENSINIKNISLNINCDADFQGVSYCIKNGSLKDGNLNLEVDIK